MAAEFSNRECIHGTRQADSGHGVVNTSRQPVALVRVTSGPAASVIRRAARAWPQPRQARWPASMPRKRGCFLRRASRSMDVSDMKSGSLLVFGGEQRRIGVKDAELTGLCSGRQQAGIELEGYVPAAETDGVVLNP